MLKGPSYTVLLSLGGCSEKRNAVRELWVEKAWVIAIDCVTLWAQHKHNTKNGHCQAIERESVRNVWNIDVRDLRGEEGLGRREGGGGGEGKERERERERERKREREREWAKENVCEYLYPCACVCMIDKTWESVWVHIHAKTEKVRDQLEELNATRN